MIPQHSHVPRRFLRSSLALIASVAAVPLVTSPAHAARSRRAARPTRRLESEIQSILDRSLADGEIEWNCCGVDAPPTGVNAAVRIPGRDDIVVAAGINVDGTPFDSDGPYATGSLQDNLVETIAWQLADEGDLDLDATIDTWLPDVPNADRVTIGMLPTTRPDGIESTRTTPIVADLSRRWTLAEVIEGMVGIPPLHEPGTIGTEAADHSITALAYVLEQVTGDSIADLIEARIITPLGLGDTFIQDGANQPDGYQHGVFAFDGQVLDTSMCPNVSYYTYFGAVMAVGVDEHRPARPARRPRRR